MAPLWTAMQRQQVIAALPRQDPNAFTPVSCAVIVYCPRLVSLLLAFMVKEQSWRVLLVKVVHVLMWPIICAARLGCSSQWRWARWPAGQSTCPACSVSCART